MEFEWDENKRRSTIDKHGIDFIDCALIFEDLALIESSPRDGEDRYISIGPHGKIFIAVVWTKRGGKIRLISARKARNEEKEAYEGTHQNGDD